MGFQDIPDLQRHYDGQAGELIEAFYLPVLSRATRYDRRAGYFDSASLVAAAAGLAALIRRLQETPPAPDHPPMRLITGAEWSEEEVRAYERGLEALRESLGRSLARRFEPDDEECRRLGLPPGWRPEADQIAAHRLGTLAWLVANGLLEVRVALPLDSDGRPRYPGPGGGIHHSKVGLLCNGHGDVIAFQGSVNETSAAWTRNRESFIVFRSWRGQQDHEDIAYYQAQFERLWAGHDPTLLVLPLPDGAVHRLRQFAPRVAPTREIMAPGQPFGRPLVTTRVAAQFLLDAPRQAGGAALVLEPLSLRPYPHQGRVADRAAGEFPRRFLFCDEVGLGKTIEAGLALRRLLLAGAVRRVLLMTPKSLVRQWQEELREKFALTAWYSDGRTLADAGGRTRPTANPWDEEGIVIVSRQFVARRSRLDEVLVAPQPWDLVIVDEAHAARRQRLDENAPNLLLLLLQELHRRGLMRGLWLLTATPMQLNPSEVHDLLTLCGVDRPDWGEWRRVERFVGYFDDLRVFATNPDVRPHVLDMAGLAVRNGASPLPSSPPPPWEAFEWHSFMRRLENRGLRNLALRRLPSPRAEALTPTLARQTPLAVHMFRHTRTTLRAYQEGGVLDASVPNRDPRDVAVAFDSPLERALYQRVDALCSEFYRLAETPQSERRGVGFLQATFQKRVASSFYAFRRSLERRRDLLLQAEEEELEQALRRELEVELAEDDEDEDEPLPDDFIEQEHRRLRETPRQRRRKELNYLRAYIRDLEQIPLEDSKFKAFRDQLDTLLVADHRVIVFTQYLDTLDFLRSNLIAQFGARIMCYSGRGGEVWDAGANEWRLVEKAVIKARAQRDHPRAAQVLLATDAASEGLNLQEFSAVVNYDLPWNPMRVEQRIGRIDRIGQPRSVVSVVNLYLEDTIEQDAYHILRERIHFFEEVVGPLQPILAEMPRLLRRVALGEIERAEAVRELERLAQTQPSSAVRDLEDYVADGTPASSLQSPPPVMQAELTAWCLEHPAAGMTLTVCPEPGSDAVEPDRLRACYRLTWLSAPAYLAIAPTDEVLITFDAALADRHPPTASQQDETGRRHPGGEGVRLLTWGDPLLEAWLLALRGPALDEESFRRAGVQRTGVDYYEAEAAGSASRPLSFGRLLRCLNK